jgi:hypothetical protein
MLIQVLAARTALYVGVRTYKKRQKKKIMTDVNSSRRKVEAGEGQLWEKVGSLFSDPRDDILRELSSSERGEQSSKAEERVNQSLAIAVTSLSLSGTLIYPLPRLLADYRFAKEISRQRATQRCY